MRMVICYVQWYVNSNSEELIKSNGYRPILSERKYRGKSGLIVDS